MVVHSARFWLFLYPVGWGDALLAPGLRIGAQDAARCIGHRTAVREQAVRDGAKGEGRCTDVWCGVPLHGLLWCVALRMRPRGHGSSVMSMVPTKRAFLPM